MDEALIKPQKVRRTAKIQAPPPGTEPDVTAQGTLVEVADPRALRPKDFRTDFVYRPASSCEDVAMCELPPLLESVLSGTDAVLLVCGAAGADQAELMDGSGGMPARAVAQLAAELQVRKARHRASGSGGYSSFVKLHVFQIVGDRIEDLLTDRPEASRIVEGPQGVLVEGLRSATVVTPDEAVKLLEMAWRRQIPDQRPKIAKVVEVQVTQADYFAGWGLFGRLLLIETPVLDCLAEDKGLVQLREGFDTFRGVYHLRNIVHSWQPRKPGDVTGSVLTWLLRDALCGGSVSVTVMLCLRQQQPAVSVALLEFLDSFSKVETNPVCCDHRVAGLLCALRAEFQALTNASKPAANSDANSEETRRIILELEKRLRVAERQRDEAMRSEEEKKHTAVDFRERYVGAIQGQEAMHDRLLTSEEEHLRACEGLVAAQLECEHAKEALGELQYKDNLMLMVLEQEVVDTQLSEKQLELVLQQTKARVASADEQRAALEEHLRSAAAEAEGRAAAICASEDAQVGQLSALEAERRKAAQLRLSLDAAVEARVIKEIEVGSLENRLESLRVEYEKGALHSARQRDEELAESRVKLAGPQRDLQELRRNLSTLREEAKLEVEAERQAKVALAEQGSELTRLREEFHRHLADLSAPLEEKAGASAGGSPGSSSVDGVTAARAQLEALHKQGWARERRLQEEVQHLEGYVQELQQQLVWSSQVALDWAPASASSGADQERLRHAISEARSRAAAAAAAGGGRERDGRQRCEALKTELDAERQRRAELGRSSQRQELELKRLRIELEEQRLGLGAAGSVAGIQQQLLVEVEALRGGGGERRLREENEALRAKVERLDKHLPSDQRMQGQRLAFLEKSLHSLEAERSELLVRATVAEEQLVQLQRHLKDMTASYQMQIVQLKMQAGSR